MSLKGASMFFDANTAALLDASARAVVMRDTASGLDLDPLNDVFFFAENGKEEIVTFLTERVEAYSGGMETLRVADQTLFAGRWKGALLHLVLCPINTPAGEVFRLDDGMMLIKFGPYSNGFVVDAERAE